MLRTSVATHTAAMPSRRLGLKFGRGRGGIIRHKPGVPFIRELTPTVVTGDELPTFDRILTVAYGSGPLRFETIAAAMNEARDGDVIRVNPSPNAYPATSMNKAGVWLVVNGSPLSARIASINLPGARTGVWGFDCGSSTCKVGGQDAKVLRCWWHGDRRGEGNPQIDLSGLRATMGHCKVSDSTSCGIKWNNNRFNVIFRTLVDDLRGTTNGTEAIGSDRGKIPPVSSGCLVDHCRIDRYNPAPGAENEAISNKRCDNIFRFVTLARSRSGMQLTNRHDSNNLWYGCWVDSGNGLGIRDRGNFVIGCGGPGELAIRSGSVTVDEWRARGGSTPATTRMRAEDTLIVGPQFGRIKVGEPGSPGIETKPCTNTRIERNLGPAPQLMRETGTVQVSTASIPYPVAREVQASEVGPTSPWTGYPTR